MTGLEPETTPRHAAGTWPLVHAERAALALTMAMAGRGAYCDELHGDGAATLRERSQTP